MVVVGFAGALLLVLGFAPGAHAAPVDFFSINDVSLTEGDAGTANLTFTISYTGALNNISVDWATADNTATAGADYTASSGTATFTAASGSRSRTITVPIRGDLLDEANESFFVNLTNPLPAATAAITDAQGVGTITDNDPLPSIAIGDPSVTEGDAGTANLTYTVTLSPASGRSVTVNYATANGTATQPADYTSTSGTLTFTAGQTARTVVVPVVGDTLDEIDETVLLNLSGATNATIADTQGVGTITDDDALPSITINDVSLTEGNSGTASLTFTATLSPVSGRTVTVGWATADGSALAPADYTASSGTVTFTAGQTTRTFTVSARGDTLDELDETFAVNLSSPTNATIADGQGVGTILDNDATPSLRINDLTVTEGDAGTTTATFTVTLSAASGLPVAVTFATSDGTATAPADYAAASGTVSFAPGQTTQPVAIAVNTDLLDEANETYNVNLSNPTNATIADNLGVGTITDDDPLPSIVIDDPSVTEGDAGTTTLTYTLTLSASSGRAVNVRATTANGTATQPADYVTSTQNLVFTPGVTTLSVPVTVNGDVLDEPDADTVLVNLSSVTNATIADAQGVGSILDDDALPALSIADASRTEGNSGTASLTFTVSLAPVSGRTVTVAWATSDATAAAPGDYTASSGTVTFTAGQTTRTFTVPIVGDTMDEFDETFRIDLSAPTNATVADGQAVGTIVDNDAPPTLSVNDVSVTEGDAGTTTATFTVGLSAMSGKPIGVDVATADGTAVAGADYDTATGTLAFAPGAVTATVDVTVDGDVLDEFDETFTLTLSSPTNATILDGTGLATIVDDDLPPALSIGDLTVPEGDAGTSIAPVPVTLSAASGKTVSVDYATVDGSALAAGDFSLTVGTVTFAPGQTLRTIDVPVVGDVTYEGDEAFTVALAGAVNVTPVVTVATVTIANDDPLPSISIGDVAVTEGDTGDTTLTLTATLSNPSAFPIAVDAATADGTAAQPADYDAATATMTFAPGELTRTLDVTVHGDAVFERDETLSVDLSNASGATIADPTGVGTIANDDAAPVVDVAGVTVNEGDAGDTVATFTLTLTGTTDLPAAVDVTTVDGTAGAPGDFAAAAAAATFAPGATTQTVDVAVHGDRTYELDETFALQLSAPVDATIGTGTATGTIVNDDPQPAISIADVTVIEGNAGPTTATLTLSLSNPSAFPTAVDVATADGSAVAPADYAATTGTVSFAPGDLAATFDVAVAGDVLYEGDETFAVALTAPAGGTLADATADVTIIDDEGRPTLSAGDVAVGETNRGTTPATFQVSVSTPSSFPIVVEYATVDGTATADDYAPVAGTITLAPGELGSTIPVDVVGDLAVEPDETFTLELRNPVGALVGDGSGLATILDDDVPPEPTVSVDPISVPEGDGGLGFATFTIRLSNASASDVVTRYLTMDGSATGGEDFVAATGQVTIPAGQTSASVPVAVLGDTTVEPDETFSLSLVWASGAHTGTSGTATIVNDDRLTTRMSIRGRGIGGTRIAIRGRLVASGPGLAVDVTLYRRVGGRWVEVAIRDVRTVATTRVARGGEAVTLFRARFRDMLPGRYLARAAFPGDDANTPSHARGRFRLR